MRTPLSWLRDFAPFQTDVATIAAALDDLGLVVESIERVGEGLGEVSVARVVEIGAIEGADRIRRVVVDAGADSVEVVCGAWNFAEGDLVPLVRAGAVLPGGLEIARGLIGSQVQLLPLSFDGQAVLEALRRASKARRGRVSMTGFQPTDAAAAYLGLGLATG